MKFVGRLAETKVVGKSIIKMNFDDESSIVAQLTEITKSQIHCLQVYEKRHALQ
jgi:hypothetical protein